jgi:hypothetical protein
MADDDKKRIAFGTVIGVSFALLLILGTLTIVVFAHGTDTAYSAYVSDAETENLRLAQLTDMRDSLGEGRGSSGYSIANTMSTPMLVNDWKDPHRTLLVIIAPEKPLDETESQAIYDFVTLQGGKVILASDGTNANRVAGKFGVTFFDAPLRDDIQTWIELDDDDLPRPANAANVWGLSSIHQDIAGMSEAALRSPCTADSLIQHDASECRMPVMFRSPTGIKVEQVATDNKNHDDYTPREISILSRASPSAFIDRMGNQDAGDDRNPAPGDLSLIVRIDYPEIETLDQRRVADSTSGSKYGKLEVTGSIVFVADEEAFSNRMWTASSALLTGMSQNCKIELPSCWQRTIGASSSSEWGGNSLYFRELIYDMMEFDNQDLSTTVRLNTIEFQVVFDESRHVTSAATAPFTETMSTIVLLTSDDFLKWLIILNLLLLLLVAIMVVPEKENWRHVFDLTRFRERPEKLDPTTYRRRVRESMMSKVRLFYGFTRDEMALKNPSELQQMIGDPRLIELVYSQNRTYSPEELRQVLQTIRRWGKEE